MGILAFENNNTIVWDCRDCPEEERLHMIPLSEVRVYMSCMQQVIVILPECSCGTKHTIIPSMSFFQGNIEVKPDVSVSAHLHRCITARLIDNEQFIVDEFESPPGTPDQVAATFTTFRTKLTEAHASRTTDEKAQLAGTAVVPVFIPNSVGYTGPA